MSPSSDQSPAAITKKILALPECPPALMVLSADNVRRERATLAFLRQFLPNQDGRGTTKNLAVTTYNAKDLEGPRFNSFKDEISSISLFSVNRFFIVRHIEELPSTTTKTLIALLQELPPKVSVLCVGTSLPSNSVLAKFFKSRGSCIDLGELSGQELKRWVQKELRTAGVPDVASNVIELLAEVGENNPDTIVSLIEQLALYVDSPKLTADDLTNVLISRHSANEFQFIDAMVNKNVVLAETLLKTLLTSGKNAFILLSLISRTFSNYLLIQYLLTEGKQPAQIKSELHMTDWLFQKNLTAARRFTVKELAHKMRAILRADSKLKNKSLGPETILSELVYQLGV